MSEVILTNARVVTPDAIFLGTVRVVDGMIAEVAEGLSRVGHGIDCAGDLLLPGLIELHTDHMEIHATPRPGVQWPAFAACLAHDAQMIGAGITTVFDALCCGDISDDSNRLKILDALASAVSEAHAGGYLRADHRLHLRCEVSCPTVMTLYHALADNPLVGIVSLMDHTPGQRQFVDPTQYRAYYMGKHRYSDAQMDDRIARQQAMAARYSAPHRQALADDSHRRGRVLASHDDATLAHVAESAALGVHFCEFPTTREAAKAAHDGGMSVLMGSPNLVRGGSHSGNVSVAQLVVDGTLDILSSDYVPVSLLHATVLLTRPPFALAWPEAVAKATANPARAAGLNDRGRLEAGLCGDIIRVHDTGHIPVVRRVWRQGQVVA